VSETSEDLIDREKSSEIIRLALASLTPREEKVIRMRFGIVEDSNDHENFPITAEEIEELNRRSIEEEV
jgi:DNA-directed RNA polymerase sigma subunit (sigma70/sigma32)